MTHILLVEDDSAIASPLERTLSREGYRVSVVADGKSALSLLPGDFDCVILDLGLPDMDGLDVARRIRQEGLALPILILTARSEEVDMVVGLDAGADDYVTKPFRLAELLARVRALVRRVDVSENDGVLSACDLRIDTNAHRVFKGNQELELTGKEYDLLVALAHKAGNVVSREELLQRVWASTGEESTKKLDMHISWLRRKLGECEKHGAYITTVRGMGFRLER